METSLGTWCASQGSVGNPKMKLINEKALRGLSTSACSQGLANELHYRPPRVIRVDKDRSFCRVWREPDLSAQENKYIQASDGSFTKKKRFTRLIDACTPSLRGFWLLAIGGSPASHTLQSATQVNHLLLIAGSFLFFKSIWTENGQQTTQEKERERRRKEDRKEWRPQSAPLSKDRIKQSINLLVPDCFSPHLTVNGLNKAKVIRALKAEWSSQPAFRLRAHTIIVILG